MRILLYFGLAIVISNCSLNQDSKYWTEDSIKKKADNQKLINTLKNLRDLGNSIIVVEHDEDIIKEADYL